MLASFLSRYAGHRDVAVTVPEFLYSGKNIWVRYSRVGGCCRVGLMENEFIANFTHPSEIPGLFWEEGLEMQALLGVEGLVSKIEDKVNGLTGDAWQRWVDLNYQAAGEPALLAGTEHLLAVARKPAWRKVLRRLAVEMDDLGLDYKVSGGASVALHGVWQAVKDLDIEMSAEQAYCFGEHFKEYTTQPVRLSESDQYRSHFGKFEIESVKIDVMGDLQRREGEQIGRRPGRRHWI